MTRAFPLTSTTLAGLLRSLDDREFAEFVADFWLKMGWDVSTDGPIVTVSREEPRSETERMRVLTDDRSRTERVLGRSVDLPDLDGIDVLVLGWSPGEETREVAERAGVSIVDVDDLYHRLLYAVGRSTCRSLCRRHLGRAIDPIPPSERSGGRYRIWLERLLEQARGNRRRTAAAGVAIVLVLAFAAVGVIGLGGSSGLGPGDEAPRGAAFGATTPVGAGAETVVTITVPPTPDTPAPSPTSTRTGEERWIGKLPGVSNASGDLPEAIYFNETRNAVLTFIRLIRTSNGSDSFELRLAWRTMTPETRPSYSAFLQGVQNGTYRALLTYDRLDYGMMGAPVLRGNESVHRVRVAVFEGSYRTAYGFKLTCGERNRSGRCWQISDVLYLSPEMRPTPEEWATDGSSPTATSQVNTTDSPKATPSPTPSGASSREADGPSPVAPTSRG